MAITESDLTVIPRFFVRSQNRLNCRGIQITDAAQRFEKDKTYLVMKFSLPYNSGRRVASEFLDRDMRRAFAVYSRDGNEVAFYAPSVGDAYYSGGESDRASWAIALIGKVDYLTDIKCANRKFKNSLLATNGEYIAAD